MKAIDPDRGGGSDDDRAARSARWSRRSVLLASGGAAVAAAVSGVALVETRVLPGRARLHAALGLDGPDGTVPDVEPGPMITGELDSQFRSEPTQWAVSYPPETTPGDSLPVLITLHGRGGDHRAAFDGLGLDRFLASAVASGVSPFAVASVDGGSTYWHRRADGSDSGAMVTEEFVPILADQGLDVSRIGLLGWSMGGYGALLLASSGALEAVRAVGTLSAALWTSSADAANGAFDDAADFEAHDVFERRGDFGTIALRMDCGEDDPFAAANRAFVEGMRPHPEGGVQPGAHTDGYWRRMLPEHLTFIGRLLGPS